jgi:fructokinase
LYFVRRYAMMLVVAIVGSRHLRSLSDSPVDRMPSPLTIAGLGEILWDVFPDGAHFGGAPANFACNVRALAGNDADVFVVGSVGRDELGLRAVEILESHNVNTRCVSLAEQPTGRVVVTLDDAGRPSFEIAEGAAWDNIAWSSNLEQLAARAGAVCFGTLGQRTATGRRAIQQFVQATRPECVRLLDINLRAPFWNEEVILQSLKLATVLKLNDAELPIVAQMLGYAGTTSELLQRLLDAFSLKYVALTRGPDGAVLRSASGEQSDFPSMPCTVVDTVGAGDAYSAAMTLGILRGLAIETINAWGIRVASFVCSQAGATPQLPDSLRHP